MCQIDTAWDSTTEFRSWQELSVFRLLAGQKTAFSVYHRGACFSIEILGKKCQIRKIYLKKPQILVEKVILPIQCLTFRFHFCAVCCFRPRFSASSRPSFSVLTMLNIAQKQSLLIDSLGRLCYSIATILVQGEMQNGSIQLYSICGGSDHWIYLEQVARSKLLWGCHCFIGFLHFCVGYPRG